MCVCVCDEHHHFLEKSPRTLQKKQTHTQQKKQVTNTPWGERVTFKFDPAGDATPKALHVSPFMDMQNEWCVLL